MATQAPPIRPRIVHRQRYADPGVFSSAWAQAASRPGVRPRRCSGGWRFCRIVLRSGLGANTPSPHSTLLRGESPGCAALRICSSASVAQIPALAQQQRAFARAAGFGQLLGDGGAARILGARTGRSGRGLRLGWPGPRPWRYAPRFSMAFQSTPSWFTKPSSSDAITARLRWSRCRHTGHCWRRAHGLCWPAASGFGRWKVVDSGLMAAMAAMRSTKTAAAPRRRSPAVPASATGFHGCIASSVRCRSPSAWQSRSGWSPWIKPRAALRRAQREQFKGCVPVHRSGGLPLHFAQHLGRWAGARHRHNKASAACSTSMPSRRRGHGAVLPGQSRKTLSGRAVHHVVGQAPGRSTLAGTGCRRQKGCWLWR